jgi:hypothetical protein
MLGCAVHDPTIDRIGHLHVRNVRNVRNRPMVTIWLPWLAHWKNPAMIRIIMVIMDDHPNRTEMDWIVFETCWNHEPNQGWEMMGLTSATKWTLKIPQWTPTYNHNPSWEICSGPILANALVNTNDQRLVDMRCEPNFEMLKVHLQIA